MSGEIIPLKEPRALAGLKTKSATVPRATGITDYLKSDGSLAEARLHGEPRQQPHYAAVRSAQEYDPPPRVRKGRDLRSELSHAS